ncbi:hypothetical protein [Kribbella sancticallisti]
MTAALVIVPVNSASARTTSAQGGQGPRVAGGTRTTAGELPWMVRLSTGCGATTDTAQRELTALPSPGSAGSNLGPGFGADSGRLAAVPAYRTACCIF